MGRALGRGATPTGSPRAPLLPLFLGRDVVNLIYSLYYLSYSISPVPGAIYILTADLD